MAKNFEELKNLARGIRDEALEGANTSSRVGQMFVDLIEKVETVKGGGNNQIDSSLSKTSDNAVANRVIAENFEGINDRINALVSSNAKLSLNVSPSLILVGDTKDVTVTARISGADADSITLGKVNGSLQSVKNQNSATMIDNITGVLGSVSSYTATAEILRRVLTASAKVEGVHPIYFGSAFNFDEVINSSDRQTARKTPNGTYTAEIAVSAKAVFAIPSEMIFEPARLKDKIEGFGFPVSFVIEQDGYKFYESGTFSKSSKITLIYQ